MQRETAKVNRERCKIATNRNQSKSGEEFVFLKFHLPPIQQCINVSLSFHSTNLKRWRSWRSILIWRVGQFFGSALAEHRAGCITRCGNRSRIFQEEIQKNSGRSSKTFWRKSQNFQEEIPKNSGQNPKKNESAHWAIPKHWSDGITRCGNRSRILFCSSSFSNNIYVCFPIVFLYVFKLYFSMFSNYHSVCLQINFLYNFNSHFCNVKCPHCNTKNYISVMSKLSIVMHKSFWWEHVFKSFHLIAGSVSSLKVLMNLCEFSHTSRGHFKFWKYHNLKVLFRKDKKNFCRKGKLLHKRIFCRILNVKTCLTLGKMCLNV